MVNVDAHDLLELLRHLEVVSRRVFRALTEAGFPEGESRILFALEDKMATQAELARAVAMDTGQVNRTVLAMKTKDLIAETKGGGAKRLLILTERGQRLCWRARKRQIDLVESYLADTSDVEAFGMLKACKAVGDRCWESDKGPFVREAKRGDTALLMRILSDLGHAPPQIGNDVDAAIAEHFLELHRRTAGAEQVFLVAEIWGEVVGGIVVTAEHAKDVARVELLVVGGPPYQGQGAGSVLLREAMTRMAQKGYRTFTASYPKSPFGPTLFSKLGWTLHDSHKGKLFGAETTIEDWRSK